MKVLILCDQGAEDSGLRTLAEQAARETGCETSAARLDYDAIRPCVGCFNCWVKTPGLCVMTDDGVNDLSRRMLGADAMVLLTRMTYGGFSPDIKAFLDRCIPNISPFFQIYHGQMHHRMRYERFPALFAVGYGDATEEERLIFQDMIERVALNMRPPHYRCLTACGDDGGRAAARELGRALAEAVGS